MYLQSFQLDDEVLVIISSNDVIIFSIHPSFFSIIDFHEYNLMSYLLSDSIP